MSYLHRCFLLAAFGLVAACGADAPMGSLSDMAAMDGGEDFERGPNNGRMLRDGDFALELAIFETGVPPEFRVWATDGGRPVDPGGVELEVRLTRLGGRVDEIRFRPQADYLRGDTVVYEPHSFVVHVAATVGGRSFDWQYDSFEGRTRISSEMARAFGLATMPAGPATLEEVINVYGTIAPDADRVREVSARFDGAIESVLVSIGDTVIRGQVLARVESNESLQVFSITAPIDGVVTERSANAGEQTAGRRLFTIVDPSSVWAELAIFPSDRARIASGATVRISPATGGDATAGTISNINVVAGANQAVTARVVLDNADGRWALGTFVSGEIAVAEYDVPLAVRREALQSFRDFTVVYAQYGDEYEVRMLELGRQDDEWAEVLGGLEPGTLYVTENSYVLKADVEKSGASHDH